MRFRGYHGRVPEYERRRFAMASKPQTIRHGAIRSRPTAKPIRLRALLRRAALPGVTVAGLVWAVASLFAPAPAPRAEVAGPAQHASALTMMHSAAEAGTTGRLQAVASDAALAARFAGPEAEKSARGAFAAAAPAPVAQAENPFDKVVRTAALTPERVRIAFQTAYLADAMLVARNATAETEASVASAETNAQPAASDEVTVAALTPANVPLPQSRPRLAETAKPDKPVETVVAAKPEKPAAAAEKPAGLFAGLLSAKPEKPAAPEKPEKPAKTLKPSKPGKPEVAMAAMAFARPDSPDRGMTNAFNGLFNKPKAGNGVAVYDISAGVVIMPNGDRLEAHSGIGKMADNPRFVHVKMNGPTPPNTYKLSMREKRFHGVEAIRMTPIGDEPMHGRAGILAHSYLLRGRKEQSHGCVAFADYPRFLKAFKAGHVTHLVVVPGNGGGSRKQTVASNGA